MSILHHLAINKHHKGIFMEYIIDKVIKVLSENEIHFKQIINILLESKSIYKHPTIVDYWELLYEKIALKLLKNQYLIIMV